MWTQTIGDQIGELAKLVDQACSASSSIRRSRSCRLRAHELFESGHVLGKVVLTVRP